MLRNDFKSRHCQCRNRSLLYSSVTHCVAIKGACPTEMVNTYGCTFWFLESEWQQDCSTNSSELVLHFSALGIMINIVSSSELVLDQFQPGVPVAV